MTIPRPEHPRPQLFRPEWKSLNGEWGFKIDSGDSGLHRGWAALHGQIDDRINVPFCPESSLSGIGETDFMKVVWYHREFGVPDRWKDRRVRRGFGPRSEDGDRVYRGAGAVGDR